MLKLYPDWLDPHVLWLGARAAKKAQAYGAICFSLERGRGRDPDDWTEYGLRKGDSLYLWDLLSV
jgi:hypothetical protein